MFGHKRADTEPKNVPWEQYPAKSWCLMILPAPVNGRINNTSSILIQALFSKYILPSQTGGSSLDLSAYYEHIQCRSVR
jgi:hypothetical protein